MIYVHVNNTNKHVNNYNLVCEYDKEPDTLKPPNVRYFVATFLSRYQARLLCPLQKTGKVQQATSCRNRRNVVSINLLYATKLFNSCDYVLALSISCILIKVLEM